MTTKLKKRKPFKINAKIKDGKIVLDKDSFLHIFNLTIAQKHLNDQPVGVSVEEIAQSRENTLEDVNNLLDQVQEVLGEYYELENQD